MKRWQCVRCGQWFDSDVPLDMGSSTSRGLVHYPAHGYSPVAAFVVIMAAYCPGCASRLRVCRVCGCTDEVGCAPDMSGHSCSWVEKDLCSRCVGKELNASN